MGRDMYLQLACVPKRLWEINKVFKDATHDSRKMFIEKSCFKGLLFVKPPPIRVHPILCLIKQWNVEKGCFVLGDGREWVFSDEDVARVYGLPSGFGKSPIKLDETDDDYGFADEFAKKYELCSDGEKFVKRTTLEGLLKGDRIDIPSDCIDYWRIYVLYALSTLLIPLSHSRISFGYLKFLESPETSNEYNWAGLVKDWLIKGLNSQRKKMGDGKANGRPTGNLHCLMHLFYDLFEANKVVGRCYTCSINRKLNVGDLCKLFPHLDPLKVEYKRTPLKVKITKGSEDSSKIENKRKMHKAKITEGSEDSSKIENMHTTQQLMLTNGSGGLSDIEHKRTANRVTLNKTSRQVMSVDEYLRKRKEIVEDILGLKKQLEVNESLLRKLSGDFTRDQCRNKNGLGDIGSSLDGVSDNALVDIMIEYALEPDPKRMRSVDATKTEPIHWF